MKSKFNFTLTGFIIGLILISMSSIAFSLFLTEIESEYNINSNSSFARYNITKQLKDDSQTIRDATRINQNENWLDVIGGFFSAGYSSLKIAGKSVDLFIGNDGLLDEATQDIEFLSYFKSNIITIVLIGIFLGVFLTVLVKWKI